MNEEWRTVPGYPKYQVSNFGNVRSINKILKQSTTKMGYLRVSLYSGDGMKSFTVHRLVCLCFIGERPSPLHHIEHIDHDKTNNKAKNLRYCLPEENYQRNRDDNRYAKGERHSQNKLSSSDVIEIFSSTLSQRKISGIYGISQAMVNLIKNGKNWSHITETIKQN